MTNEFAKNEFLSQEDPSLTPEESESESVYSLVEQHSLSLNKKKNKTETHSASCHKIQSGDCDRLAGDQMNFWQFGGDQTLIGNESITPYACFYGPSVKKVKAGWLDKLSPQGYGICSGYCVTVTMYVCMRDIKFVFSHCLIFVVEGKRELFSLKEHQAFVNLKVFSGVTYPKVSLGDALREKYFSYNH